MSTRIHNGYKLEHRNPFQLHRDFRTIFKPLWDELVATDYVRKAVIYADKYFLGDPKICEEVANENATIAEVLNTYRRKNIMTLKGEEEEERFQREPELVLGQIPSNGIILAFYFGDNSLQEHLHELGLTEFKYWNGSDRPKEFTQNQWDERSQMWDDAFYGGNEPPVSAGISLKIISDYEKSVYYASLKANELIISLPTDRERAFEVATLQAGNDYVASLENPKDFQVSGYSEYVHNHREEIIEKVQPLLKSYDYVTDIQPNV